MLKITGAKTYFQIGTNDNLFDFSYVDNVAHAHLLAAEALLATLALRTMPLDTERVDGEAFFIGNGTPVYFWDFTRAVWIARGTPADAKYDVRDGDCHYCRGRHGDVWQGAELHAPRGQVELEDAVLLHREGAEAAWVRAVGERARGAEAECGAVYREAEGECEE
jgi:nucleoside-diphosphate-sugar epimerase